jgi:hypothetical protein
MLAQAMIGGHPHPHAPRLALALLAGGLATGNLISHPARAQSQLNDYDSAFAAYHWADPQLDWPLKKLCDRIPALSGLDPASDQSPLPGILARVGANVQAFRKNFMNTTSTETVEEDRTKPNGEPEKRVYRQQFRYLMLAARAEDGKFIEYRTDLAGREQAPRNPKPGFIKTLGFASMPLQLGPEHQPAYDFKYLGSQAINGRKTEVIAFAGHPVREAVSGDYVLFGKPIPLIVQGVAWIDAASFEILRMHTDLLAPLTFAGLPRLSTDVVFRQVTFRKGALVYWLPQVVDVTAEFYGRTYHNRHTYSDYQLFSVESGEKVQEPKLTSEPPAP